METSVQQGNQESVKENTLTPFSFKGRVRRRTFWITYFICNFLMYILSESAASGFEEGGALIFLLIYMFQTVFYAFLCCKADPWNTQGSFRSGCFLVNAAYRSTCAANSFRIFTDWFIFSVSSSFMAIRSG